MGEIEYIIVFGEDTTILEKRVRDFQKRGWKCQGGVSVILMGYKRELYQAMVK